MATIKSKCPECGMDVTAPAGHVGAVKCPICDVEVRIQAKTAPAHVASASASTASLAASPPRRTAAQQAIPTPLAAAPTRPLAAPTNVSSVPLPSVPKTTTTPTPKTATQTQPQSEKDVLDEEQVAEAKEKRELGAMIFFGALAVLLLLGLVGGFVILVQVAKSSKKDVAQGSGSASSGSQRGEGAGIGNILGQQIADQGGGGPGAGQGGEQVAQRNPLPPDLQAKVNDAVTRGTNYLYEQLKLMRGAGGHQGGESALMAFTLLECGVPANDDVILQAAAHVRQQNNGSLSTYGLACAIMFLNKLNNPQDVPLIQSMALRLIAGQAVTGGWGYNCQRLNPQEEESLRDYLGTIDTNAGVLAGTTAMAGDPKLQQLPVRVRALGLIQSVERGRNNVAMSDNSNTQFALIGLWIAKKHGIPVQASLALVEHYFRKTQAGDGSWNYGGWSWKSSMTCAGLLGLAVGKGVREEKGNAEDDPELQKGMRFLAARVETPPVNNRIVGADSHGDLYYLWSLERVAMIYDLEKIGGKDWYRWAADRLTLKQAVNGSWSDNHGARVDTSFALLVLKRVNVAKDLTTKLNKLINTKDLEVGK